jgi:hypothetical protein
LKEIDEKLATKLDITDNQCGTSLSDRVGKGQARWGSERSTVTRVIMPSCRLSFVTPIHYLEKIYTTLNLYTGLSISTVLYNYPMGLSNVPDIKRKHCLKKY